MEGGALICIELTDSCAFLSTIYCVSLCIFEEFEHAWSKY